jgi:hypothetical protein
LFDATLSWNQYADEWFHLVSLNPYRFLDQSADFGALEK